MAAELPHDPVFRTIDMSAEAKKIWGPKWAAAEIAYRFSSGRTFELKTEDAGIYETSPDF